MAAVLESGSTVSVEDSMNPDMGNPIVEAYARDYSVSYEQAQRRLDRVNALQEIMAEVRGLEASRLAGWGIDHADRFMAWIWLTGDDPPVK